MPARINRQLKRNLKSITTGGRPEPFRAKTGNGAGVVAVPGYPYKVWIRPEAGGQPIIVYNLRGAPSVDGWPVIVGESDYNPGALQILEADSSRLTHLPEDSGLPPHADSHFLNGVDPIWADTRQVVNLLAVPSGMTVTVYEGMAAVNGAMTYVPQTVVDLTSSIPATGAQWAVIRTDDTGTLDVLLGAALTSYADLQMTNIPDAGGAYYGLWAVKLYDGMTAISNVTASPDLVDLRFFQNGAGGALSGDVLPATCQGRLTLETGVPISTTDQNAKTTLYFTPYTGNIIGLYDGVSAWTGLTFSEISLDISAYTANKNYDIWAYNSSGTAALDSTVWTNDTTRATALTTQDGIYVKTGATTRRYLGTIRITGTTGECEDSLDTRFVWNYYNRRLRALRASRSTAGHTYTTASWRAWNNDTTVGYSTVLFVAGVIEERVQVTATNHIQSINDANMVGRVGIGINTTTANSCNMICYMGGHTGYARLSFTAPTDFLLPQAGYNYLSVNEYGNNPSITYYDVALSAWLNA